MRVLLITYSFPPAAGVGVLRAFSLAKYLPENGVQVEVLTARNAAAVGHDASLLRQLPAGVKVHRSWTLDLPFAVRKAIKKAVSRPGGSAAGGGGKGAPGRPGLLKRVLGNLLLPDPQVGWLPFALPAARRIVRRSKVDAVLITVPPFSSVLLAKGLRKSFPGLPIVVDFRDEWLTTTIDLVSFNNNPRARAVAHKAEAEAVQAASAVVCVTHAAVRELRGRYPGEAAEKFQWVSNGFDLATGAVQGRERAAAGATVLTYLGTVYGSTDPTRVVEAFLGLPEEMRRRIRFRFVGHIESAAYRETLLRLGEQVELVGFLPQAEALRYIETTDYLLLVTHDPINVAAKLYDYLGSGRPILAAVHPTGDVRRILDETRAGWAADGNDVEALQRMLTEAVERRERGGEEFAPDVERIGGYHRRPLAARYAGLLGELTGERTGKAGGA